jgi:hypothetical protein
MSENPEQSASTSNEFEKNANQRSTGMFREFVRFLMQNKKWWLAPIIIVLVLLGVLVILGGTAIAPFIYTLF